MNFFRTKVWHCLELIGDMMILDMLFILTSLPVLTAGPSFAALYRCFFKIITGNPESVFSMYFKAFRENFIQSFLSWLIILFFAFDIFIVVKYLHTNGLFADWFSNPLVFCVAVLLCSAFVFVLKNIFAVIVFFDCNLQQGFVNSMVFPCKYFFRTLVSLFITGIIAVSVFLLPFLITLAFSLSVYCDCKVMLPAFRKLAGFSADRYEDKLESGLEDAW